MSAGWRLLTGLPAWEVTEIPRLAPPENGNGKGNGAPDPAYEKHRRAQALASACLAGTPAAFGWVREQPDGPVRVIAAGQGMRANETGSARPDGEHLLSFPPGSLGKPLPPGGLGSAFAALPCWVPVAVLSDELLRKEPAKEGGGNAGPGLGPGLPLEEGLLGSWEDPFGYLVLAEPVSEDRRREMLAEVSLAQQFAQRHDTPRAMIAARRTKTRHDELRAAAADGLWDIWLLAGAESKIAAARVATVLRTALDLRGMPFALIPQRETGTLLELLGAPPGIEAGTGTAAKNEPGSLTRDVLTMYRGDPRGARPYTSPTAPETRASETRASEPAATTSTSAASTPAASAAPEKEPAQPWQSAQPGQPTQPGRPQQQPVGFPGQWFEPPPAAPSPAAPPAGTGPRPAWLGGSQPAAPHRPQNGQDGPRPNGGSPQSAESAAKKADFPDPEPEFPCAASSDLLAALAVPPAEEIPGVEMVLRPRFDVTPGKALVGAGSRIQLGDILDRHRRRSGDLAVRTSSLNRHTFVCGATGSGKSQTTRHLLESATAEGIPWLVIEPAKAEYKLMAARLPDAEVITIRPGDPETVAAGINPLEPAAGPDGTRFPLQAHADLVRALFLAAFQAEEPFPQVLAAALTRCYKEAGWDLVSGEPTVYGAGFPSLEDLQAAAMEVVNDIGYGQEVRDNIRGFVSVRIGSLQAGTTGRFLSGQFPLDYDKLLTGNVVLEIEDCGDDTDKAFLTGAVLVKLTEHLRMRARSEGPGATELRHLTVIEEAHRLLRQPPEGAGSGAAAKAVEMFADLLAEIRAYGEGLVIAEQIPSKLIPDAIKNTAVKIVHRLPAQDDRDTVGATMNLTDEQSRYLVTLKPGEAAVFTDGMDYPVLAKLPDGSDRENTGGAQPASPAGLVTGTRPACPVACIGNACTLRQVSDAARTAADDPRLTLWAELTVVAHLTGHPMPDPTAPLGRNLLAMDHRHRDCAIATAVQAAVAARIPALSSRIAGPALATHVAAAMRVVLDERRLLCAKGELQWIAPAYFWDRILSDLRDYQRHHAVERPHPSTAAWEASCGESIPGATCAQQSAIAQQRNADARKDPRAVAIVLFGNRSPSAIENAVGGSASDPGWRDRLYTALTVFDDCTWPVNYLTGGVRP